VAAHAHEPLYLRGHGIAQDEGRGMFLMNGACAPRSQLACDELDKLP
jgi:hypothetical protein